jgi:hypothetical protein
VLDSWSPEHSAQLGIFIHLRYLNIEIPDGFVIPDSIGNLKNLETLYVGGRRIKGLCLPKGIFKLQRLRNLYRLPYGCLLIPCDSEETLGSLQVLSVARINYDPQNSLPVVPDKFPNVRKLKIKIDRTSLLTCGQVSFPDLHHLRHLEILRIGSDFTMLLPGDLNSIPSRITKLTLNGVVVRVDGVTVLGKLPNLRILKLRGAYSSSDYSCIHVMADLFPRLQFLKLSNGLKIREWKHERGAMPCLGHLVFSYCDEFTSPPELLSLSTLRYVEVIKCPRLAAMLQESLTELGFKLIDSSPLSLRMVREACVRNPNLPGIC